MQKEIFTRWMEELIKFAKPTKEKKVLLTLDNHSTHIKNLEALELAKQNNIIILTFPPHTSHKLQPVDVTFNKSLSTYISEKHNTWMRLNKDKGNVITLANYFTIFTPAYNRAASAANAINGFKKAGIYPLNWNVFSEQDFACGHSSLDFIGK